MPNVRLGPGSTETTAPHPLEIIETTSVQTAEPRHATFNAVLSARRSVRNFGDLRLAEVVELLESTFALRSFAKADDGGTRRFRPVPSAGARQPLTPLILIENAAGLRSGLWRYEGDTSQLVLVSEPSSDLDQAWEAINAAGNFDTRPPAVVVLAARFDATLARYPSGTSLVWRDAGVALGFLHLAATSLGLSSCILGTAGVLSQSDLKTSGMTGNLIGDVGCLALGGPAN